MGRFIKSNGRHRTLEGWPLVFTVLTTLAILVGGAAEFIPMFLIDGNVPTIESVTPYTPLELEGRDIYIREGCVGCHSQQVRPFRHELERYGEYNKPGEHVYDHPFLWGSKRTGPDLARVGGKYPDLWHVRHLDDPRSTSPNSIMPPYSWMMDKSVDFDGIANKMETLQALGVPYSDADIAGAAEAARAQASAMADGIAGLGGPANLADKEIIAITAYLQRLGADIRN